VYMVSNTQTCNTRLQMPRHRWGHVSGFIFDSLFLCGGTTDQAGYVAPNNTCDSYYLPTQEWRDMEAMVENRHGAASVTLLGNLYVLGGSNGVRALSSVEIYDPSKSHWSRGVDMPEPLIGLCAAHHEDAILVTGGHGDGYSVSNRAYLFNVTTNRWHQLPSMEVSRYSHGCSFSTRLMVYSLPEPSLIITGGVSEDESETKLQSSEMFNLASNQWTKFNDLPFPIAHHQQMDLGLPMIFGGQHGQEDSQECSDAILDFQTDAWTKEPFSMPQLLRHHSISKYPKDLVKC